MTISCQAFEYEEKNLKILPKSKTMSLGFLQENFTAIIALSLSGFKSAAYRTLLFLRPGKKMVGIVDLPIEVLAEIFTYVPIKDHVAMSEVCKAFHEASKIELIWMSRCRREFNIDVIGHDFSCRDIYTRVLHKYGSVIGLWQPEISSYGGLLQVEFENGRLIGSELFPPLDSNIKQPLRKKLRFIVQLGEDRNLVIQCVGVNKNHHDGKISKLHKNNFSFKCHDRDAHACKHQGLIEWLNEEALMSIADTFPQRQELLLMKYLVMCHYNYSYRYNRVFLPTPTTNVPIQPGLFKGTYGAHGLELVMLAYDEDGTTAKAVKVSGDPNIPAGKITFVAELNYSMVLSVEDQMSITTLEVFVPTKTDYDGKKMDSQPFRVPTDCLERFKDVPKTCTSRFYGNGQIAGHGFTNPSFTNGHWIIFDEDLFGFLWLELLSLSMYHRVKENLIQ